VRCRWKKLELAVILGGDRELPRSEGSITRDQFWKIGCIIEEQVPVWTVGMPHQWNTHEALFSTRGAYFDLDMVHHLTVPLDGYGLKEAVMTAARGLNLGEDSQERAYASARLVNYELIWCNLDSQSVQENDFLGKSSSIQRDTLRGAFDEFEYALFKRGEDCEVHLRLKKGAAISPRVFRNTFSALLRAVALLHGQQAWPQWERVEIGSRVLDEFATAPRTVPKTIHTLLRRVHARIMRTPRAWLKRQSVPSCAQMIFPDRSNITSFSPAKPVQTKHRSKSARSACALHLRV
jgi:hypothetical protein